MVTFIFCILDINEDLKQFKIEENKKFVNEEDIEAQEFENAQNLNENAEDQKANLIDTAVKNTSKNDGKKESKENSEKKYREKHEFDDFTLWRLNSPEYYWWHK